MITKQRGCLLLGALGAALLGCKGDKGGDDTAAAGPADDTGTTEAVDPLSWDVAEAGPYQVGYRTWELAYVPAAGLDERTIRINVWYPTEDTDGDTASYTVGTDALSFEDASLAPSAYGGSYPVHLHSHGSQGYGATSAFLARHYASHGWVFLAPDHTDNTLIDNADPRPTEFYLHRSLDLGAALDSLDADAALGGLADTDGVLLSGHSFGVYSTWATIGAAYDLEAIQAACDEGGIGGVACHEALIPTLEAGIADSRVLAAMPMAGSASSFWFGETGIQDVTMPVMLLAGSEDDVGQAEEWERTEGMDYTWVELEGGCHQTFALGACETLDPELGFRIVRTFGLAMGRAYVLGDSSVTGVLSGEEPVADEVIVQSR